MNGIKKAIDNLKETLRMQKSALRGLPTSYQPKAGLNDDIKATDLAISALEKQLNNGWIPCSERLPEKNGTYIVTQAMHSLKNHNEILRIDTEYADFSNGAWRRAKHLEIIAWQPLPEKYTEVSE